MTIISPNKLIDARRLRNYLNSRADVIWEEVDKNLVGLYFLVSLNEEEVRVLLIEYEIDADYSEI